MLNKLLFVFWNFYAHARLRKIGVTIIRGKFYGRVYFNLGSDAKIIIGEKFICNSGPKFCIDSGYTKIVVKNHATLIIGKNSGISSTSITVTTYLSIGDNVSIGAGTIIFDTDFHSTNYQERIDRTTDFSCANKSPIIIDDDVFIGAHSIITKGVHIGSRSIVAAGSVVVNDIAPDQLWGGNPAKFIKYL